MIHESDWSVKVETNEDETCVHAHLKPELDITDLNFLLLDEERKLIVRVKVTSHEINFCTYVGNPIFAQLGDCVKYVDGSGVDYYHIKAN